MHINDHFLLTFGDVIIKLIKEQNFLTKQYRKLSHIAVWNTKSLDLDNF